MWSRYEGGKGMNRYIDADNLKETFAIKQDLTFNKIIKIINEEPKADVRENIKGEWKTVSIGCDTNEIRCTACKQITSVPADRTRKLNFCPECGADMREVKK